MEPTFLVSAPVYFHRQFPGPGMAGEPGDSGHIDLAPQQWAAFRDALSKRASVRELPPSEAAPALACLGRHALAADGKAVLANPRGAGRGPEAPVLRRWFAEAGFQVVEPREGLWFGGAADCAADLERGVLWLGYGHATALEAGEFLAGVLETEVVPLRIVDERFARLETCLCPVGGGRVLYYPDAFDERSRRELERRVPPAERYAVSAHDAVRLACLGLAVGRVFFTHHASRELESVLGEWGMRPEALRLSSFARRDAGPRTLALDLSATVRRVDSSARRRVLARRDVDFATPRFEPRLLEEALALVHAEGGSFHVLSLDPARRPQREARITARVEAPDEELLDRIVALLVSKGGVPRADAPTPARLAAVEMDGVAPEGFYGTTIYRTEVCLGDGSWIPIARQRMDGVIVVDPAARSAVVRLIRDLRAGELVVVGSDGIAVHVARQQEEEDGAPGHFAFMSSQVSSERRVETAVDKVAWEMWRVRQREGRIVVCAGPVVVHTGGAPYLEKLARAGYISALLGGNAIAVHDIENSLYGTSLGVNLKQGAPVHGGHMHHITAINAVRRCGSIRAAVEQGVVRSGLFHTLVEEDIPFVLAGSIRDDGPLPDTIMDLVEAQSRYMDAIQGAEIILLLSSMLHSIGVGNMTPAGVRLVCVDINSSVATKLMDRGSLDAIPVVTDVGLFLNLLWRRLQELGGH
ncbi:MAG: TIGR00300 family protein [Candidatus Sumerlaeia bacterium]|nr:TIGR00300 family protein [Candidatus Sumerlaeia bacterium]